MPIFVVTATHTADQCPLSNSKVRKIFKRNLTERPKVAQKAGVKFLAGPLFSFNHKTIVILDAPKVESVMEVLTELHIAQWNSVEVQPYLTAQEADKSIDANEPLY